MGLYLLNLSVDTADPYPEHIPEDLSINDQESIIELVVEKFLGYEEAFKEYDDTDNEDHNNKTNVKINLIIGTTSNCEIDPLLFEIKAQQFADYTSYLTEGFQKLDTPPPQI